MRQLGPRGSTLPRNRSTSFVSPIPGGKIGRTDQGVDISASPGDPLVDPVPGQSTLVGKISNWYKGQPLYNFLVTSGPFKGKFWYVAEQADVGVPQGGTVQQGEQIGRYAQSGTATEWGWSADRSGRTLAVATTGYHEGQATPAGLDFARRVSSKNAIGANVVNTTVPSYVPKQFVDLVRSASQQTGIPASIVAAQANAESGFNPNAVSGANAEGWLQFEPPTFKQYGKGSPFNPQDETGAYINYMNALLAKHNGSIRDALAEYNAGATDIAAGYGYADKILAAAGAPRTITAGSPSTFGGTRPDGGSDTGQAVDQVFADYEAEVNLDRTAPRSTFSGSGWKAPFQWWWQSFSGTYAKETS